MTGHSVPINILVLCMGNSCRSIFAEALINSLGQGRLQAFSAGSRPAGAVNPDAIAKLTAEGLETAGLRSKSWDEFSGSSAPRIDIVITVCDNAAGEVCPIWNGAPVTVPWGIPDPAAASELEAEAAFEQAYVQLKTRVQLMLELPLEEFDARMRRESLQRIHDAVILREAERS